LKDQLIDLFNNYPQLAFFISLLISVIIAVLGVLPSVFITAANILFFGFWQGTLISLLGEAIGAAVAFWLYRKGFKKVSQKGLEKHPKIKRLVEAEGKEAFYLIFSLRLLPFVPSGLVTFAGAIGRVSALIFVLASSLGKIPALLIEAYSVYQVTEFGWQGKVILVVVAGGIIYWLVKKKR
jgi:uncharacterized membrane protein YdjX (TVP38/TMEM64 family)